MTDKVKDFLALNRKWVIGIALMSGINIGIAQTQLLNRPDREEVRVIVEKEVKSNPAVIRLENNQTEIMKYISDINKKKDKNNI